MTYSAAITNPRWVPAVEEWRGVSDQLYPGSHVIVMGSSRTYHRMVVNLEDAGFDIRDGLVWFVDDQLVPLVLARKPLEEDTIVANVLKYGTGGIRIDACRIPTSEKLGGGAQKLEQAIKPEGWDRPWRHDKDAQARHAQRITENVEKAETLGRFPANIFFNDAAAAMLDEQTGILQSGHFSGKRNFPKTKNAFGQFALKDEAPVPVRPPGGGSRFFFKAESEAELRAYLVRLILPPGGILLEPFE